MELPEKLQFLLDEHRQQDLALQDTSALSESDPAIIRGINRFFANKLAEAGIKTIRDLSHMPQKPVGAIEDDALRRWIMIAKILTAYSDLKNVKSVAEKRRVLLTGIEAAGKTSTLKSLQKMHTVSHTRPTLGVAAEKFLFLGHNLSVFDLGGQRTFREMYLAKPEDFFSETMLLIFIVDIQTYSKFEDVFNYFGGNLRNHGSPWRKASFKHSFS